MERKKGRGGKQKGGGIKLKNTFLFMKRSKRRNKTDKKAKTQSREEKVGKWGKGKERVKQKRNEVKKVQI